MRRTIVALLVTLAFSPLAARPASAEPPGYLRFFGYGYDDADRVKIRVDDPSNALPGPPADIGATDFTIEFWLAGRAEENTAPEVACGDNIRWIYGNIVLDRDRYNQDRKFGVSLAGGRVVFGVSGDGTGDRTVCSASSVLDGEFHHIAIQRRRADGWLWLFVDGALEASEDGPDGDVSYPDDGVPGNHCGGPCTNSDPFLVIGAEKHDADPPTYPSFAGLFDELRLSTTLRYDPLAPAFTPQCEFAADAATAALYHFAEAAGDTAEDVSGAAGGPSPGVLRNGGPRDGPRRWAFDRCGPHTADAGVTGDAAERLVAAPNPAGGRVRFGLRGAVPPDARLEIFDLAGRSVGTADRTGANAWTWDPALPGGPRAAAGVYVARLRHGARTLAARFLVR